MEWKDTPTSGGYYWIKLPTTRDSVPIGWHHEIVKVYYCSPSDWKYVRFGEAYTAIDMNAYFVRDSDTQFSGPIAFPGVM